MEHTHSGTVGGPIPSTDRAPKGRARLGLCVSRTPQVHTFAYKRTAIVSTVPSRIRSAVAPHPSHITVIAVECQKAQHMGRHWHLKSERHRPDS